MKEFVCIVCPRGCRLKAEEINGEITVIGNTCKRGKDFAVSELTEPKRTICSTVKTSFEGIPVVPVRVSEEIPKDRIFDVMKEINSATVTQRLDRGDAVIKNVLGLGADVIITSSILKTVGKDENNE